MRQYVVPANIVKVECDRGTVGNMETIWFLHPYSLQIFFRPSQCELSEGRKLSGTISLQHQADGLSLKKGEMIKDPQIFRTFETSFFIL